MPGKQKRKRERSINQQENFCFFCWGTMLPSALDHEDSACCVNLDPPGAPWKSFMHWPRFVAAHVRCAREFNEMRFPGQTFALVAS